MRVIVLIVLTSLCFHNSYSQLLGLKKLKKSRHKYEEVNFEDMMRRYFAKETSNAVEGIYSVSCVIIKRSKGFLSDEEKEKTIERKENYAKVAIIKDYPSSKRDFIEVSLSYSDVKKFPIMGEMNALAEGKGLIYHHTEPDGKVISFSMISESPELIEGEYSEVKRNKTITYKLSYLKTYPKSQQVVVNEE